LTFGHPSDWPSAILRNGLRPSFVMAFGHPS
jgi:hypothetical protein